MSYIELAVMTFGHIIGNLNMEALGVHGDHGVSSVYIWRRVALRLTVDDGTCLERRLGIIGGLLWEERVPMVVAV